MSFKDLFIIWGQSTKQRTTDALQRADMEMQQRNMGITERRKELLKLIELENKRLNGLRNNLRKIRQAYKKERTAGGSSSREFVSLSNALSNAFNIRAQYDRNAVNAYLKVADKVQKKYERTPAMHSARVGFETAARGLAAGAVQRISNKDDLKDWLQNTNSKQWKSLTEAVKKAKAKPAAQSLIWDIAVDINDELDSVPGSASDLWSTSNLDVSDIADILLETGVDKYIDQSEAEKEMEASIDAEWKQNPSNKQVPRDVGRSIRRIENRIKKLKDKAPTSVKKYIEEAGYDLGEEASIKGKIRKYEEQLDKSPFPSYDYGDVQKRAGEILISQDVAEKIKSMSPEDVAYFKSMPGALKYADKEDISKIGSIGSFVQKLMAAEVDKQPDQRSSYGALLEKIKGSVKTEEEGSLAASLITSRILRAAKSALDAEKIKSNALKQETESWAQYGEKQSKPLHGTGK